MNKLIWNGAALLLATAAGSANASDKLDKRVAKALECSAQADASARLACYDATMAVLKSAVSDGELEVSERQRPRSMEGLVAESGMVSDTHFWVVLDNGDRWRLQPSSWRKRAPAVGTMMKIKRGLGGNFWISGPGWKSSDAEFEGHKD